MARFRELGGWWAVGQFAFLVALLVVWLSAGGAWAVPLRLAGAALAGIGALLAIAGVLNLGPNLTPYPAPRVDAVLVERGPYRLVRHPIYGGAILGAVGLSLLDGNPVGLALSAALAGLLLLKSRYEEARLIEHFPDYGRYQSRVRRRLIPWVL